LKIGFIGLGAMGGRLAGRLTGVGELTVFDASERAMEPFTGRAVLGSSIAEAGTDADVVGVCARTGAQVDDCVDALLPVMKRGSVLMIHSTVSPDNVKAAAKRAEPHAITVIDAPVTVTRSGTADAPFVCMMIGGEHAAAERTKPLLEAYATDVIHVGPLGSAMSLKIINNLVSLVQIIVAEEAFRLAALTDVPAEALEAVMKSNGALTPTMMAIASRAGHPPADEHTAALRTVQASNGVKDLALAESLARSVDTASATATFAKGQYWFAYTANLPNR
jgi:3-hydroxyisobutyrate dehydrogenase